MATMKRKRRFGKLVILTLVGTAALVVFGFIANWIWVSSGSNQWEKAHEKDGVVVHTLKQPGKFVLQMKATKRIRSKLSAFVSVMQDVDAMCSHGCYEAKVLKREESDLPKTTLF